MWLMENKIILLVEPLLRPGVEPLIHTKQIQDAIQANPHQQFHTSTRNVSPIRWENMLGKKLFFKPGLSEQFWLDRLEINTQMLLDFIGVLYTTKCFMNTNLFYENVLDLHVNVQ